LCDTCGRRPPYRPPSSRGNPLYAGMFGTSRAHSHPGSHAVWLNHAVRYVRYVPDGRERAVPGAVLGKAEPALPPRPVADRLRVHRVHRAEVAALAGKSVTDRGAERRVDEPSDPPVAVNLDADAPADELLDPPRRTGETLADHRGRHRLHHPDRDMLRPQARTPPRDAGAGLRCSGAEPRPGPGSSTARGVGRLGPGPQRIPTPRP